MECVMIGLGKMGGAMAERLVRGGHRVVVFDLDKAAVEAARSFGAEGATSLAEAVGLLTPPRAAWVMVPSGKPTEATLAALADLLAPGDVVADGGNSDYKDSIRHAAALAERGIGFADVGTSGGVWGLAEGYCLMAGGEEAMVEKIRPLLETLAPAPDQGWARVGPVGAGHFVKMVHNGIEYGIMEAYAEGFDLLAAKKEFAIDLEGVAEVWRHGSVIRSWLLDLAAHALSLDPALAKIAPEVADSGEGRWTAREGIELGVPLPVLTLALQARFSSRGGGVLGHRLLAALRREFGGHAVKASD